MAICAMAITPGQVRWLNENADTTRIVGMLVDARDSLSGSRDAASYVVPFARRMLDATYAAGTLEASRPGDEELLTVSLDSLDCTTFVETVAALAITAADGRTSWRDFINNLESLRYRSGEINGYASRLHYVSDWIINNSSRGNITEATGRIPSCGYEVKSLDFMTAHRDLYPALASDDDAYRRMRNVEDGYRNHRFPIIKKRLLLTDKKTIASLREGDIVAITGNTPGLDVIHMGIITISDDGTPRLIHASSAAGKAIIDPLPLGEYLKRSKKATGVRILRLNAR